MCGLLAAFASLLFTPDATEARTASAMPWKATAAFAEVDRELYREHPRPKTAAMVSIRYVGPGLLREERYSTMARSDTREKPKRRWSKDNGRSWSDYDPLPDVVTQALTLSVAKCHSPASAMTVQFGRAARRPSTPTAVTFVPLRLISVRLIIRLRCSRPMSLIFVSFTCRRLSDATF